jgi:hypothetical protein
LYSRQARPDVDQYEDDDGACAHHHNHVSVRARSSTGVADKQPSSTSPIPAIEIVGAGTTHADAVFSSSMPTRCSTKGPVHDTSNGHAELVFPVSATTHLPARTLSDAGSDLQQGMGGAGMATPAGCLTNFRTWLPDVPGECIHNADTSITHGLKVLLVKWRSIPQISVQYLR